MKPATANERKKSEQLNTRKERHLMKTVNVSIDWNNLESIKIAERTKATLESKGYTLQNSFGGLFKSVLVYGLETKSN